MDCLGWNICMRVSLWRLLAHWMFVILFSCGKENNHMEKIIKHETLSAFVDLDSPRFLLLINRLNEHRSSNGFLSSILDVFLRIDRFLMCTATVSDRISSSSKSRPPLVVVFDHLMVKNQDEIDQINWKRRQSSIDMDRSLFFFYLLSLSVFYI